MRVTYSIVLFLTIGQSTSLSLGLCRNSATSRKACTQDSIFGYRSKFNYFFSNELVLNAVLFSMIFKPHYYIHLSRFTDCSILQETCKVLSIVFDNSINFNCDKIRPRLPVNSFSQASM